MGRAASTLRTTTMKKQTFALATLAALGTMSSAAYAQTAYDSAYTAQRPVAKMPGDNRYKSLADDQYYAVPTARPAYTVRSQAPMARVEGSERAEPFYFTTAMGNHFGG